MSRIFVTGDTHNNIDIHKLSVENFPIQKELTKDDYLIVCGDWGAIWYGTEKDNEIIKWWTEKPWTTIVVLGNHENYNAIESDYLQTEWHGAKCYKVNYSIYIMKRGEIFNIDGKTFFAFGGAQSHDVCYRKKDFDWWEREIPSKEEYDHGFDTLAAAGNKVDYIITHEMGSDMMDSHFIFRHLMHNAISNYIRIIKEDNDFKYHFCGHHHIDFNMTKLKTRVLYDKIVEIKEDDTIESVGFLENVV